MPKTEIPLKQWDEIRKLERDEEFQMAAEALVELTDDVKKKSDRIAELRLELYDKLVAALPEGEHSVQYGDHRLTASQGSPRKTLDKQKLMKYISAAKLEKCYTAGDPPRPTVVVTRVEETVVRKAVRKLTKKG